MSKQSHILYIEEEIGIQNPEIKLLERTIGAIHRATMFDEAHVILRLVDIDFILIDISMTSAQEWTSQCMTFIQDPSYIHIAKVVIDIDIDTQSIQHRMLRENPSIIHFHDKVDPDRYDKLVEALQRPIP